LRSSGYVDTQLPAQEESDIKPRDAELITDFDRSTRAYIS